MSDARLLTMPYPGLRPFEEKDHPLFFGREVQVNGTLHQLEDRPFLAVVGSSGSGKSSFVRAGLLPAVREGFLLRTTDWLMAVSKPGHRPYENLAVALAAVLWPAGGTGHTEGTDPLTDEQARSLAALRRSERGLLVALAESGVSTATRLFVVVDQFEEIFAFRRANAPSEAVASRDEAAAFVRMLLRSSLDPEARIRVVLTMRSDFIGDCEAFLGLPEAISRNQFLVPRLDRGQMEEVITRPAAVPDAGYRPFTVEADLVNRIINDAGDRADQLPLMQHALMRTWKAAVERANGAAVFLSLEDYRAAGEIENALSLHADAAWNEVEQDERQARLTRQLFLLLCDVSPDGQISRRRPRVEEVMAVTGASLAEIDHVRRVFQADDRNFLLPPADQQLRPDTLLDISHESLIRQWRRFNGWVAEERASGATFARLRDAALRWPKEEPLLRDPALTVALGWRDQQRPSAAWASRYGGGLEHALAYLDRSQEERQREEEAAARAQQQQLQEAQRRATEQATNARRFRNTALALMVLAIVAAVAAGYGIRENYYNAALAAITGGLGTVRSTGDPGIVAIAFQPSAESPGRLLRLLGRVGKVASLDLSHTNVGDGALAELVQLPELESLDLSFTDVGDAGVAHLTALPQLTHLALNDTRITTAALPSLQRLVHLRSLDLSRTRIHQAAVDELRRQLTGTSLTYAPDPLLDALSRYGGNWDQALARAGGKQEGDRVRFFLSPLLDSSLKFLDRYAGVELNHCQNLTNEGLKYLQRNKGLTHLQLMNDSQISDEGLENLAGIDSLRWLEVNNISITDRGLLALAQLKGLTTLILDGTEHGFTDRGMAHLATLPKLERLTITNTFITDAALHSIAKIRTLRSIWMRHNPRVRASGYAALAELPQLRELTIEFEELTAADVKYLERLSQLKTLYVSYYSNDDDKSLATLRRALPKTTVMPGWIGPAHRDDQ